MLLPLGHFAGIKIGADLRFTASLEHDLGQRRVKAQVCPCASRPPPTPAAVIRKKFGISELAPEILQVELKSHTPADNVLKCSSPVPIKGPSQSLGSRFFHSAAQVES